MATIKLNFNSEGGLIFNLIQLLILLLFDFANDLALKVLLSILVFFFDKNRQNVDSEDDR